jgi:PAS domain S-box-containing protein
MSNSTAAHVALFPGNSELAGRMRTHDWASTPLGVPDTWPQSLKTVVRILLTSRYQMWMGWGDDLTFFYNDAYRPTLGVKHEWALGAPANKVWEEIWPDIGPRIEHVLKSGEATWDEGLLLFLERRGFPEETYHTFSYSPLADDTARTVGMLCVVTEETDRIIGERRLRSLRDLASEMAGTHTRAEIIAAAERQLGANLRDLPFTLIYLFDNDGTARLVGTAGVPPGHQIAPAAISAADPSPAWPASEVLAQHTVVKSNDIGRRFQDIPTGAWDRPARDAVLAPLARQGQERPAGFIVAGVNPHRPMDETYLGFIELIAGQLAASIASADAYEEERRRAEALAEIDRAKTTFFSNVSHEFRTPLTLMLSPLEEVLAKPPESPLNDDRHLVSVAHRNGVRLLKLVNALLDFSRIEAGRTQGNFEALDLSAFTAELASTFRSAIERAGLKLTIDCAPLPHAAMVDPDMWEKVVLNLLSNALKFTFDGGITVTTRPDASGKNAEVIVSDTGTGIPDSELPHLFERFHRVEGARGRSIEGSGIGLALVLELVKLHGGTIDVQSEVGKGSSFAIRLPLATATTLPTAGGTTALTAYRAQAYLQEAGSWLGDDGAIGELPTAMGAKDFPVAAPELSNGELVLLADDNRDMRNYVTRLLRTAGYRVEAVANGEAALAAARSLSPRLVLSDVMMPELDGVGLMQAMRADPQLKDIPVILLSARAGEESKVEGLRAGADDYLTKPFSARELVARVESNLKLAATRRETERVLREEAQILDELNRVGTTVSAELDLERAVQAVTDSATRLTGASFGAFFYNVIGDTGESYTLYTLSGVPREAFSKFPMPRNTAVFAPTFAGEATVRSSDIRKDPRFGKNAPYYGHPKGHLPVVSYLATSVVSRTGEVLGGMFFGHPEEGVFDRRAERIVEGIAVQAAIAIDKARLYQSAQQEIERRRKTEAALVQSEQSLEQKVRERTAELADANSQLIHEITERERAEGRFQHLVEGVADHALYMLEPDGIVANWNTGAQRIKGYAAHEIVGRHFETFYTEEDRAAGKPAHALEMARNNGKFEAEGWRQRKDGSRFWASVVINPIHDSRGDLLGFAKITRDITERREVQQELIRAQEQLAQAQKMEGIGQLTGGVAHDFNNLLTVILGNLETAQRASSANPNPDRLARSLEHATLGAQRAASLTQRLLAFSRRSPLDPKPIDASRLVSGMSELLRRTLGEQVMVETVLAGGLWRIHADPNQLEIGILNLAVNARDAMPDGGQLTIETANAYLDEGYAAAQSEVVPGQYVVISISDTGIGMDRETMARAFEPFFTTKDIGHGTGLGLSQVYGFAKQSGGHIKIYSEPGHGTTVKLYLPRLLSSDEPDALPVTATQAPTSVSGETILVVEDDPDVRANTTGILRELRYTVLEAPVASTALELLRRHPEIDLLFSDVGLPGGMNGKQLADAAHEIRPDLKVLFTTGYARNAIVHGGRLDPGVQMIPKPFTYAAVATKIAEILGSRSEQPRVLLVEDEILVQMVAQEQLQDLGCKVETAGSVTEAMDKVKRISGGIDLAIVDIGLPDRKGDVLAAELRALYPKLPIVIASGYGDAGLRDRLKDDAYITFVGKPYTIDDLRRVVDTLPGRKRT